MCSAGTMRQLLGLLILYVIRGSQPFLTVCDGDGEGEWSKLANKWICFSVYFKCINTGEIYVSVTLNAYSNTIRKIVNAV